MHKQSWITLVLLGAVLAGVLAGTTVSRAQDGDQTQALVAGNNAFAFDLYRALRDTNDGNLIFSPYSISLALAMTYGGARGNTEAQMAGVLHFTLPQEELHSTFQAVDASLPRTAKDEKPGGTEPGDQPFRLNIANALWGQQDFPFKQDYLDLVNTYYGAGLQLIDFAADPEAAREQINQWVEDQTENRIQDLLAQGTVTPMTRLILTNAIYFKASWQDQFNEARTKDGPFTLLDGSTVTVPLMADSEFFGHASGEGYEAVALPYEGGEMAMLILLPDVDNFEGFEAKLDANLFQTIVDSINWTQVDLTMPRWESTSDFSLSDALIALGMADAFDPNAADFSGMVEEGADPLAISDVIHKAFVKVNEEGTEAAAATAVIMEATAAPAEQPIEVRVDHPFLYAIYDQESGAILFMGRVLNPAS